MDTRDDDPTDPVLDVPEALAAAGFIGAWQWDIEKSAMILDRGMADLLMGDASVAGTLLRSTEASQNIHPDDLVTMTMHVVEALRSGRAIEVEYRSIAANGPERRVRASGRVYHDRSGVALGVRGIAFDVTDLRIQPVSRLNNDVATIEALVDHLLAARALITSMFMAQLLDMSLLEAGRLLADAMAKARRASLL